MLRKRCYSKLRFAVFFCKNLDIRQNIEDFY
jgi:hypothetical protein